MTPSAHVLDLSALPAERRAPVEERYWRELVAARVPEVYTAMLQRYRWHRALAETARALNAELGVPEPYAATPRYVQSVVYQGR